MLRCARLSLPAMPCLLCGGGLQRTLSERLLLVSRLDNTGRRDRQCTIDCADGNRRQCNALRSGNRGDSDRALLLHLRCFAPLRTLLLCLL